MTHLPTGSVRAARAVCERLSLRPRGRLRSKTALSHGERGQSLAEFALVVPFLFLILLTVADFGRYFAASINVESIARTAAEVAAQEYQRALPRADGTFDYTAIHRYAWQSVCNEARDLPNVTYNGPTTECAGIPTLVCVHGQDTHGDSDGICATGYNVAGGVPAACTVMTDPISNAQTGGLEASRYVEVRVCYRFSTIFAFSIPFVGGNLTPLSGDFFIQRVRNFTVADY